MSCSHSLTGSSGRHCSVIVNLLCVFCFQRQPFRFSFYFTAAGVKCRVAAVKRLQVHHHSADYIYPLRKHAYSNILKISPKKKTENFEIKKLIFFIFLLKT